jgi:choice-of-anchor C domain-containing protein
MSEIQTRKDNAMRRTILFIIVLCFCLFPMLGAGDPAFIKAGTITSNQVSLITNGSFEMADINPGNFYIQLNGGDTRITGWVVLPSNIHYVGTYWEASEGLRSLDLDGATGFAGGIQQTFSTVPGNQYLVSFDFAGNPGAGPQIKTMRVSADNQSAIFTFDITGKSFSNMGWTRMNWMFTADDSSATLQFVSLTGSGWGPALDNVSVTTVGPEGADLLVTKTDSPDPVLVRSELSYTVTVTNNGPEPATGVTLIDTLPAEVIFDSATPTQGSCTPESGTVTCDLGDLANGAPATVTIVVIPNAAGILTNTATVTANEPDLNLNNNTVTEATTVITDPIPSVTVTLTGCTECREGDAFSAQISVNNPLTRTVEMKIGYLLPDGSAVSIGDPHREVTGGTSFVEEFSEVIPPGRSPGEWQLCGRLLDLQLGKTLAVDCKPFTVASPANATRARARLK